VNNVKLEDLGERKAQKLTRDILAATTKDVLEISDDCAAIELGDDYLLITTDMIVRSTHIPKHADPWQIGWHGIAINLSDIASMGGEPLGVVVALGLPKTMTESFFSDMVKGAYACATEYGTSIVGGDTKESDILTVAGCAFGRVPKSEIMRRKGAKAGDIVCVTGELGKAGVAYHILEKDPENKRALKDLLEVHPRVKEGRELARSKMVTSAMDISDGLASSIFQMHRLGDMGFELDIRKIPLFQGAMELSKELTTPVEELSIYFGGDYELLVTVKEEGLMDLKERMFRLNTEFTEIGTVTENNRNTLIKDDNFTSLEDRGYEHFRWNK
jgi:thiamine-monophosphate kinase